MGVTVGPMSIEVTVRPLTKDDRELLRTATLANVNWTGEQRLTHRDVDETPDLRHYTEFRPERGDLGFVAERDGRTVGVVWALFLAGADRGLRPRGRRRPRAQPVRLVRLPRAGRGR